MGVIMGAINRQSMTAANKLHELVWPTADGQTAATELRPAAGVHARLVRGADHLGGCSEGAPDRADLTAIADSKEACEKMCWPREKIPGGRG